MKITRRALAGLVIFAAVALVSLPAIRARELWVVTDGSRQIVTIDAEAEQVIGAPIALGAMPPAVPSDIVFSRLGPIDPGRHCFVVQGRFLRVVDAQTRTITNTIDVGLLLPPGLTLLTMRGASAGAPRNFVDGSGTTVLQTHLFVAADVMTAAGTRPYFLVFDDPSLALIAYGELLPVPALAMQVEVLGMPHGGGFERAWFTVQEQTNPPRLHAILIDTPQLLPADDWTIRRDRVTVLPSGSTIPLTLDVAGPYGTPLPMMYEPTSAIDAPLPGRLVNIDFPFSCPVFADGSVIDVTGIAPQSAFVASIGSPAGTGSPGQLRVTSTKDCTTTTTPVGLDPRDVVILDELDGRKVFVANHGGNSVSSVRWDGSHVDIPLAGGPAGLVLRPEAGATCGPRIDVRLNRVDADLDGLKNDVQITWSTTGCSGTTVFRVFCSCKEATDTCPPECDGIPGPAEAVLGGDWEDLGSGTGTTPTVTHKNVKQGANFSYNVEPSPTP